MSELFLGIDTSNYKTSAAVVDERGRIVCEKSEYLEVPEGKRGLRQSEAFFHHSNRMPQYVRYIADNADMRDISAIGVSSRPRRIEGSYMPCFLAGMNAADEIAAVLGIPMYTFSHQEGHAAAVIEDPNSGIPPAEMDRCLLLHLSGGTTEFLLCEKDDQGYDMKIVGGTRDISIGQLIDRTGVAMGLPFPSGAYLDRAACSYGGDPSNVFSSVRIDDGYFNLSGQETRVQKELASRTDGPYDDIACELFSSITDLIARSVRMLADEYKTYNVIMAGGVASSRYVRRTLPALITGSARERCSSFTGSSDTGGINIVFGTPELSGDNAVGTARLAARRHHQV